MMRKITCDICNKDISEEYCEYNRVDSYDEKEYFDLCDECLEVYSNIRFECGKQYTKLKKEYDEKLEKEMKKYFKEKFKEAINERKVN